MSVFSIILSHFSDRTSITGSSNKPDFSSYLLPISLRRDFALDRKRFRFCLRFRGDIGARKSMETAGSRNSPYRFLRGAWIHHIVYSMSRLCGYALIQM